MGGKVLVLVVTADEAVLLVGEAIQSESRIASSKLLEHFRICGPGGFIDGRGLGALAYWVMVQRSSSTYMF
jgi:hypothetical protein